REQDAKKAGPTPAPRAEKAAVPPAGRKKLLIVDVADGESEESALDRANGGAQSFGVAAPREELGDIREVVEAQTDKVAMEDQVTSAEVAALEAAKDSDPPELEKKEEP